METAIPGLLLVAGKHLFQEYTAEQVARVVRRTVNVAGMASLGAATTCGDVRALCLTLLLFYFWGLSQSKKEAGNKAFLYFLGATWILPESIITFYDTVAFRVPVAIGLWMVSCLMLSLPFGALWSGIAWRRALAVPLIVALLTVPPFGVLCVVNPLLSAGVVFPGLKEWGIVATVIVASLLGSLKRAWTLLPPLLAVALFSVRTSPGTETETLVVSVDTTFPLETGEVRPHAEWERARAVERTGTPVKGKIVLLPESIAGQVTQRSATLWSSVRERLMASALIVGGERDLPTHRENSLYAIDTPSDTTPTKLYTQRVPVPVSMWKPWRRSESYPINLLGDSTFSYRGTTFGALICYESLLAFPTLQTLHQRPAQVLVVGNLWWAKRTHLARIIKAFSTSWERLYGVPFTVSLNR